MSDPNASRHPATTGLLRWFEYQHLPEGSKAREVSKRVHDLAQVLVHHLPDGPELTTGLRKLLESKDCFVRAAIAQPEKTADTSS